MFDRFTDRARKVMGLARQEAQCFNHDYIGTEHILLGIVKEGSGVAVSALAHLDVELKTIRREVEKLISRGRTRVTVGQLPFTPRAKKVFELSLEEAGNLGHTYIGTEHLLLGLIRESEGIAAQVLRTLKVKVEDVRKEVLELLGAEPIEVVAGGTEEVPASRSVPRVSPSLLDACLDGPVRDAVHQAVTEGAWTGTVGPLEFLLGVLRIAEKAREGFVATLEDRLVERLKARTEPETMTTRARWSAEATLVLANALREAGGRGTVRAGIPHLLLALLTDDSGEPCQVIREAGGDPEAVRAAIRKGLDGGPPPSK